MPEVVGRLRTPRVASAPATPVAGQLYYNTVANLLYVYNGTAWIAAGGGSGSELTYNEITAPVTVSSTTEAAATAVATASAYTFDGVTPVIVEFFAPIVFPASVAAALVVLCLFDGGTSLGFLAQVRTPSAAQKQEATFVGRRLTPTAASHTYSIRGFQSGGNGTVQAGLGGVGNFVPAFIRITKA